MKDYFMKLFLDYLNKIKLQILLMLFPTILTGMIFLLYQLPLEPILYIAVLWILTGLGTCAFGFHNYQKNIHNLQHRILICPVWMLLPTKPMLFSRRSCTA
mgnify:CR=1 FL=1